MKVRAKFPGSRGSFYGGDHPRADNQAPDVCAARFLDIFLHQKVCIQFPKGVDHAFCGFDRFSQHHTSTLGATAEFHHQRPQRMSKRYWTKVQYRSSPHYVDRPMLRVQRVLSLPEIPARNQHGTFNVR